MSTNYIGLACTFHDPAVAVVDSQGRIVFAEATERHLQAKRALNCPPDHQPYIRHVLERHCGQGAGLVAARSWSDGAHRSIRTARAVHRFNALFIGDDGPWARASHFARRILASQASALSLAGEGLRDQAHFGPRGATAKVRFTGYDHHLAHAAAACFTSPFVEAVCAVIDGFGEGSSTAFFHYSQGALDRIHPGERSMNSLGLFYIALTRACGFDPVLGEEWKVMGLAPHGRRNEEVHRALATAMEVKGLRLLRAREQYTSPVWQEKIPCPPEDLACTGQAVFEETMERLLKNLHGLGLSDNLVLCGGCALNSTFNGKLLARTPFRRLYVPSAPADDGTAVGAALLAFREDNPDWRPDGRFQTPYLGEAIPPEDVERLARNCCAGKVSEIPGEIYERTARLLADGRIVGWVQGKAEFGPRALGNRSILADPRRAGVKDRIDRTVKFREAFRPYAPSILHEEGPEYFVDYRESPYMERTLLFKEAAASKVPGVVHVNKTGRLQTVKREWNGRFHALLEAFFRISSVPVLLNTSLNVMGKPIAHSAEDLGAIFATTGMDALVVGDRLFEKEGCRAPALGL